MEIQKHSFCLCALRARFKSKWGRRWSTQAVSLTAFSQFFFYTSPFSNNAVYLHWTCSHCIVGIDQFTPNWVFFSFKNIQKCLISSLHHLPVHVWNHFWRHFISMIVQSRQSLPSQPAPPFCGCTYACRPTMMGKRQGNFKPCNPFGKEWKSNKLKRHIHANHLP